MNKKMMSALSTLPLMLAISASAQVISILPGGRGNLYVGTPARLPGPLTGVTITPMVSLPPALLTPAVAPAPAPAPAPAQVPVPAIEIPNPVIPAAPSMPSLPISAIPEHMWNLSAHENVAMPYGALQVKLAAPAKDGSAQPQPQQPKNQREALDNLFDGRSEKGSPVRSDRHQSLPEQDLESEIGAY